MAKPSYYPLTPLRYTHEDTASPSPFNEDADLADMEGHADPPVSPLHPEQFQEGPLVSRPPSSCGISTPLKMVLFPLVAIAYLAFCYTVHGKVVPVDTYGLYAVIPEHLSTIKGGITSISIVIISIALYPIYDIVASIKSEEFFRVLASRDHGVALETINYISTPSFGYLGKIMAMWKRRCSHHYILGIVASLLIWIVATLAPGALTVENVLADGEVLAFAIGAVPAQSVLNGTVPYTPALESNAYPNSDMAATIAWVEMGLNVPYSFDTEDASDSDYAAFIAPVPLNLTTTTSARWLSDVIGINPTCSWASTNLTTPVQSSANSTSVFGQYLATAYLVDFDLDIQLKGADMPLTSNTLATVKLYYDVTNHTTQASASDGSTVFLLGQCSGPSCFPDFTLELTGVNTTFTIALTDETWTMAILVCLPGVSVETREMRSDGHGIISVQPLPDGRQLTRQGNLNTIQATALFSTAMSSITLHGGQVPANLIKYFFLGTPVQTNILFGQVQMQSLTQFSQTVFANGTISPAPIENITAQYTQALRSTAKSYLAGYLGTAFVPGRISESELIFAASIVNLAISTVIFALLALLLVLAHFRSSKGVEFTLVNLAAAVHGSELPAQFAQARTEQAVGVVEHGHLDTAVDTVLDTDNGSSGKGKGKARDFRGGAPDDLQDIAEIWSNKLVFVQKRADGSPVLHMT